ncbi:hypothetical protein [Arthrobacter sp. CAN_A1]|uniref:hypothetical protein n=1 Tax=Arthrobacter sp. CAN_A1 TaxID=2787717 RepID=UPI0018C9FFD4
MESAERFHLNGEAVGWIVRSLDGGTFRTQVDLRPRNGERFSSTSVVEGIGEGAATEVFGWRTYTYREKSMEAPMEYIRPAHFAPGSGVGPAVPSYAEQLLVDAIIAEGLPEIVYLRLQDSDPTASPTVARLFRAGSGPLDVQGRTLSAERIDLIVDGRVENSHWFGRVNDDGRIQRVKSWWNGAVSYPVTADQAP